MKTMNSQPARRRTQRFGSTAKASASVIAAAAMIGGWNWIAHLDTAKADSTAGAIATSAASQAPELSAQRRPIQLAPLTIPTIPALSAPNSGTIAAPIAGNTGPIGLPDLPALAPLPTLAPLPSMPSLPPPPPANSGGGSTNSGGS